MYPISVGGAWGYNRPMRSIYDLSLSELQTQLAAWGYPAYRARQIWQGLYRNLWAAPADFHVLPAALRAQLAEAYRWQPLAPVTELRSADGQTVKTLFRLADGRQIETVLMKYGDPAAEVPPRRKRRRTLCISTQAGCAMGCTFCATGQMGFQRHLTAGEIVAQVIRFARQLAQQGERLTNVVLMGMGEPLHNYENTLQAIDRLNDSQGFAFGARRFTLSTVGLVPAIRRFAAEKRQVGLAVSLHAADDDLRARMLPIARRYPLAELMAALREYAAQTRRRVTFEWALVEGVNDSPQQARQLAALLSGLLAHVNLIPLNPTAGFAGRGSSARRVRAFAAVLEEAKIPVTVRLRRGVDIQAGCGQLASRTQPTAKPDAYS